MKRLQKIDAKPFKHVQQQHTMSLYIHTTAYIRTYIPTYANKYYYYVLHLYTDTIEGMCTWPSVRYTWRQLQSFFTFHWTSKNQTDISSLLYMYICMMYIFTLSPLFFFCLLIFILLAITVIITSCFTRTRQSNLDIEIIHNQLHQ